MNKTFYKVVRNNPGGEYLSCVAEENWSVEYPVGKWVSGVDDTPIFIFSCLEVATRFSSSNCCGPHGNSIFKCLVRNPRPFKGQLCYAFDDDSFSSFWTAKRHKKSVSKVFPCGFTIFPAPKGCWKANSIRLTKKVQ
jgi:hypothetical protein